MPAFSADDGTELAFHVTGRGEPLLCLPGGPMRACAYLGDLGGLSSRRTLVMLDLRGTGDSGTAADPATYRCDRQIGDVEALRRHLGLDRVDVLAHSAGGDLALLHAARHPDRVRTLVLITPPRARALGIEFTEEHGDEAAALRAAEPWFGPARDAREAVRSGTATDADRHAASPFFYGRDATAQEHAVADAEQSNEPAAGIYASPGAFAPAATRAAIGDLNTPALILAGELDGGPRPHVAAIAGTLPNAKIVVQPGAGHFPWLDDSALFVRTVDAFLTPEPDRRSCPVGSGRTGRSVVAVRAD
ncbi:alpha/beta fold hydrolase [Streptomyces sp. NPDC051567]|uniref:alpha/beta fold hydrolase n=1 Tax=Streptomyces sp. NPDC051567 TaxID=3365660 RepID=UPI00379D84D1